MKEYIERSEIEYPYMTMTLWGLNQDTCHAYNEGVKAAADAIAAIPAADVVEVVRCKDCKHWTADGAGTPWCHMWGTYQQHEEVFCFFGERRADHEQ